MMKLVMKLSVLIVSLLLIHSSCSAAEIYIGDFLSTAKNDYLLTPQEEKIDFLNSTSSDTSILEEVELRTETNEFDLSKQRYSIRFYPKGFGAKKADQSVYDTTITFNKARHDILLNQALKRRYLLVFDLLKNRKLLKLTSKLMAVYDDMVTVLSKNRDTGDFDINDLIKAEKNYMAIHLQFIDINSKTDRIEEEICLYMDMECPIDFYTDNLVGIDFIRDRIQQISVMPEPINVYVKESRLRLELAKNMYELEKTENKKYIRFLEASFDNDERDDAKKAFSLELGIRLPFFNSKQTDINRKKLQFLTEKGRSEMQEKRLTRDLTKLLGDLEKLLEQYDLLMEKKEAGKIEAAMERYMHLEGVRPIVLLEMREIILQRDIALEKLWCDINTNYIDFLDKTGKLVEKPLRNYISSNLEKIK